MKKIAISVLVLLAVLLVSCMDSMETSDVLAARAAEGDIKWDAKYANHLDMVSIIPEKSDRSNASGKGVTKITSNAHSSDYPGIYFRWENKQKDDGILLVKEEFFDTHLGFTLTAKVSNTYWDFPITVQAGQKAVDGLYIFSVPKGKKYVYFDKAGNLVEGEDNGCDKNINMVFLSNFKLINSAIPEIIGDTEVSEDYVISFKKIVTDANWPEGVPVELWIGDADKFSFEVRKDGKSIVSGLKLDENQMVEYKVSEAGTYEIVETMTGTDNYEGSTITVDPIKATKTITLISKASENGVKEVINRFDIHNTWKSKLDGFDAKFGGAKFIWDTEDTFIYGTSGSAVIHYSTSFELTEAEIAAIGEFNVSFAADNAAVMFVNDEMVGYTYNAISEANIEKIKNEGFKDFSKNGFLDEDWQHIYTYDIAEYLNVGENIVKFYAANSDDNDGKYGLTDNPCGLIFFGEVTIETGAGEAGVYKNAKVLGADVIKMDGDEVKGREKSNGEKKGGTTGVNGEKVSKGTSWFTYADLSKLEEGKWKVCQVVNGNNGNTKYDIVGLVFVQKNGDDLTVVINGTGADYHWQLLDVAPIDDNGQKDAAKGTLTKFTVPYQKYLYLKVSANFYRF